MVTLETDVYEVFYYTIFEMYLDRGIVCRAQLSLQWLMPISRSTYDIIRDIS